MFSLDVRPDGVGVLTYDVAGEAVNTLRGDSLPSFAKMLDRIDSDASIRAVVLRGKPESFVAGADLSMLKGVRTASDAELMSRSAQQTFARIAASKKPWVAAVHGPALGGGFELALACHARVCSDDRKTVFGFPEIKLGLVPGGNGLQRAARLIGLAETLVHGLTGKNMRMSRARTLGVADEVVAQPLLLEVACKHARALADKSRTRSALLDRLKDSVGRHVMFRRARQETREKTRGHYPAAFAVIDVLETFAARGFDASSDVEARAFGELVVSETAKQLIAIFFAQNELKREARDAEVEKIGVIGAGLMGGGIALVSASAGLTVRLRDRDDAAVAKGLAYVSAGLEKKHALERAEILARVTGTTDYSGLKRAAVVIEAVFEDLALKHQIVREVEAHTDAVFATNTSSIPVAGIAAASRRPENVVGLHYFSPVEKMPLLEVIRHPGSSETAIATAVALGKKQGKTVIVVNDSPGFYTTRILAAYMNEAAHLLHDGVPRADVDHALVDWGFPVGPIKLLDKVGRNTATHVARVLSEAFGPRMTPPEISDVDGDARVPPEEIQMRLVLAFVNEAIHCLGEGIVRSPRDADIGAVFGLGFPPFRGGPLRYVDCVGAPEILRRLSLYRTRFGERFAPAPRLEQVGASNGRFY
jgi:3-hydroxyacyl-CoA dehydrogenase / enoyl-CoA hydratase / 3-hydroxybutyryl-CoA epimerase